jgi:hypothetical protein
MSGSMKVVRDAIASDNASPGDKTFCHTHYQTVGTNPSF